MRLRDLNERIEQSAAAKDLGRLVFMRLAASFASGSMTAKDFDGLDFLTRTGASAGLIRKANEVAAGAAGSGWGSELAAPDVVRAFLETLADQSVFAALLTGGAARLPFRSNLAIMSTPFAAAVVAENAPAPATAAGFTADQLERKRATGIFAVSGELMSHAGMGTIDWLNRELAKAVIKALDAETLSIALDTGAAEVVSAGTDVAGAKADILELSGSIDTAGGGDLIFVGDQNLAAYCATFLDEGRGQMGLRGGRLFGERFIVSAQANPGELVLLNASGFAANADGMELSTGRDAMLIMSSVPAGGSPFVSMFQEHMAAVKALQYFGVARGRANCAAKLTGIDWTNLSTA